MPRTSRRTAVFTESLIREMSRVAARYGAINLSQGFPDWDPPGALVQAAATDLVLVTGSLFFDLPLPLAVVGHEGGTVLVVLNGLRLLFDPIRSDRV